MHGTPAVCLFSTADRNGDMSKFKTERTWRRINDRLMVGLGYQLLVRHQHQHHHQQHQLHCSSSSIDI